MSQAELYAKKAFKEGGNSESFKKTSIDNFIGMFYGFIFQQ